MTPTPRTPHRRSAPARARGAVMVEFVLALPFLVAVLMLVLYFGRGMMRVQHSHVVDRYEAWRVVWDDYDLNGNFYANAPGPYPQPTIGNPLMNQAFFQDKAASVTHRRDTYFPDDAPEELATYAGSFSDEARQLVDRAHDDGSMPGGARVTFTASHTSDASIWERYERPISHTHTRIEHEWKFVNGIRKNADNWVYAGHGSWMMNAVADTFFTDFDDEMKTLADQDNRLASFLRSIYLQKPGYRGPTVPYAH